MRNIIIRLITMLVMPVMLLLVLFALGLYPLVWVSIWIIKGYDYELYEYQYDILNVLDKITPLRFIKEESK